MEKKERKKELDLNKRLKVGTEEYGDDMDMSYDNGMDVTSYDDMDMSYDNNKNTTSYDDIPEEYKNIEKPYEEINSTFDQIVKLSLEILSSIKDKNIDKATARKTEINKLFETCTTQIQDFITLIDEKNEDPAFADVLVLELFTPYIMNIEYINRGIYIGEGLIKQETNNARLWFGINNNLTIYKTNYKLPTDLPKFTTENMDITSETFNNYLKYMFDKTPSEIKLTLEKKVVPKTVVPNTVFSAFPNWFSNPNQMVSVAAGGKRTKKRKYKQSRNKTKLHKKL